MARFLCFRLYGPMVAWGDIAVGERRPTSVQPSRSGVLGLIAAALGIRRTEGERLAELDRGLGFASRLDWHGEVVVDYHTAQVPKGSELRAARKRGAIVATRRDELAAKRDGDAIQSWRTYHFDALAVGCVWSVAQGGADLERIAAAMRAPCFVPYLGRKSCPLALPLEPRSVEAENPVLALEKAHFELDGMLSAAGFLPQPPTFCWEGTWPGLAPGKTSLRRDRLADRERWQFSEREEHSSRTEGGIDVPEQA